MRRGVAPGLAGACCAYLAVPSHCHGAATPQRTRATQCSTAEATAAWISKTAPLKSHWSSEGGSPEHFRIYRSDGTPATVSDVIEEIGPVDVLCIGETHDDPVAHQLETFFAIEATRVAREREIQEVVISLEMFETDVQPVLDEYCSGLLRTTDLMHDARPWSNFNKDYSQLVEFAKDCRLRLCAANAPRRYVAAVARSGREALDSFPTSAQAFLPPLPYPTPSKGTL